MTQCTYDGCKEGAEVMKLAQDGVRWAYLCVAHAEKVNEAIGGGDVRKILGEWIRAQGGAKAAAQRMSK